VTFYVTGISTPEVHPEFPPLLGTLTWLALGELSRRLFPNDEIRRIRYFTARVKGKPDPRAPLLVVALETQGTLTLVQVHLERSESHQVKADLERSLEEARPQLLEVGLDVHWVSGLGVSPGYWADQEPAPHGKPRSSGSRSRAGAPTSVGVNEDDETRTSTSAADDSPLRRGWPLGRAGGPLQPPEVFALGGPPRGATAARCVRTHPCSQPATVLAGPLGARWRWPPRRAEYRPPRRSAFQAPGGPDRCSCSWSIAALSQTLLSPVPP
jgi:hypothetical protein